MPCVRPRSDKESSGPHQPRNNPHRFSTVPPHPTGRSVAQLGDRDRGQGVSGIVRTADDLVRLPRQRGSPRSAPQRGGGGGGPRVDDAVGRGHRRRRRAPAGRGLLPIGERADLRGAPRAVRARRARRSALRRRGPPPEGNARRRRRPSVHPGPDRPGPDPGLRRALRADRRAGRPAQETDRGGRRRHGHGVLGSGGARRRSPTPPNSGSTTSRAATTGTRSPPSAS